MSKDDVLADLFGYWLRGESRFVLYCQSIDSHGAAIMALAPYPALAQPVIFSFVCPAMEVVGKHFPNRLQNNSLSFYEAAEVIEENWHRMWERVP